MPLFNKRQFQTRGIILRKKKTGEQDDYVTLYSPELGKIDAIAKSSRKITSHFCGHLETLNICKFQLYKSQYRYTITQANTEQNFKKIRENLKISMSAMLALEIFEKCTFTEENLEAQAIFTLLENTLESLAVTTSPLLMLEKFKLILLQKMGALPDITVCTECDKRWDNEKEIYLNDDHHLLCKHCKKNPQMTYREIDFNTIKLINFLLKGKTETINIVLSKNEKERLQKFTDIFLYDYTNKEIFSNRIISFQPLKHSGLVEA